MLTLEPEIVVVVATVKESRVVERGFICGAGVRGTATLRIQETLQGKIDGEEAAVEWLFNDGERGGLAEGEEAVWFLRRGKKAKHFLVCGEWGAELSQKERILKLIQKSREPPAKQNERDKKDDVPGKNKPTCPKCLSAQEVVPIVYGMPLPGDGKRAERGEIVLGGCVVGPDASSWHCKKCDERFGKEPPDTKR